MERPQSNGRLHRLQEASAGYRHVTPVASQKAGSDRHAYVLSEETRSLVSAADLGVSTWKHVDKRIERFLLLFLFFYFL